MRVAGIEVEVRASRGPLEAILLDRYSPFLGAIESPACRIDFESSGETHGAPNPPMANVEGAAGTCVTVAHSDFDAEIDLEGTGRVTTAENPYTVDHFFRVLFGLLAPRHNALMLHSCGVISNGLADVFAGQSGAGKSTLASLAEHRPLLSDEHVMLRNIGGQWMAASTPFWGSYSRPGPDRRAPLRMLWSLRQWPSHAIKPLERTDTLRLAFENAVLPAPDATLKRAVFDVAADLAQDIDSAELCFTPSATIWEMLDERRVA